VASFEGDQSQHGHPAPPSVGPQAFRGKVGQTSITITGEETQQFTYETNQYSALGLAYALDGYSESGTRSMKSTATVPFAKYGDNITYTYESEFRYGLYSTGHAAT